LFITDCSAHQRWMAFNVFNSARQAGQKDPITWLRSDCKVTGGHDDHKIATALYENAHIVNINGGSEGKSFTLGFGIPRALHAYLATPNSVSNDTVLALIEADMIFLSQLRVDNLRTNGLPMPDRQLIQKSGSFIGPKVGVAAHYLCCDNLGPPYILAAGDWRALIPFWSQVREGKGWGADQIVFAQAARKAGIHFNVFDHFMVSSPDTTDAGWSLVKDALRKPAGDVCATKKFGLQPGLSHLPTFMHVVRQWIFKDNASETWGFSKYQVPPGYHHHEKTNGILECGMPLLAEPPTSALGTSEADKAEKIEGWAFCTIVHSVNSMLLNYKELTCPQGFNKVPALKMSVPLKWTNILLEGGLDGAPPGTDLAVMKRCAEIPDC